MHHVSLYAGQGIRDAINNMVINAVCELPGSFPCPCRVRVRVRVYVYRFEGAGVQVAAVQVCRGAEVQVLRRLVTQYHAS
jgi:hypothetical protein